MYKDLVMAGDPLFSNTSLQCDWLLVYIEEAHAQDEWPISSGRYHPNNVPVQINQPTTSMERVQRCHEFLNTYTIAGSSSSSSTCCDSSRLQVVVDSPELNNPFEKEYAPWPLRLYVIEKNKVVYIADPSDCTYSVAELRDWLMARYN